MLKSNLAGGVERQALARKGRPADVMAQACGSVAIVGGDERGCVQRKAVGVGTQREGPKALVCWDELEHFFNSRVGL